MRTTMLVALVAVLCGTAACGGGAGPAAAADPFAGTTELRVDVPASGRVFVSLASPAVVTPEGDARTSPAWDLAFEGWDVFTNSGPSGAGKGAGFGPLSTTAFLSQAAPSVPFLQSDKTGGPLLDWYAYDGTAHVLYSRFHVYGVRRGDSAWKLQILAYYGERNNAPVGAIYRVRYAALAGPADVHELEIDGTAGGVQAAATSPSGCVDLATGTVSMLVPAEAQASSAWDLCFRRDTISVNGEAGGPRGVGAVDLQAAATRDEKLADVSARTAADQRAAFDAATADAFAGAAFRGDHVVSAFERGRWLDTTASPPRPEDAAWLVVDAAGGRKFLVSFSSFENSTAQSPGTVVMHIKPVSG
jgi:hypothetical protein